MKDAPRTKYNSYSLRLLFIFFTIIISTSTQQAEGASKIPWHIRANRIEVFKDSGIIIGDGNVTVTRNNFSIKANHIRYNHTKATVLASGNVIIHTGQDIISGDLADIDLKKQTGTIKNARLFLRRNNVHVKAQKITKTGTEQYTAKDAVITTCEGECPDWSFKCSSLELTIGGMAWAYNDTFRVKNFPILYSPIFVLPVNIYRKTGLLFPYYGSSNRNGLEICEPFFWAINEFMDATFYPHYMSRRGWMQGIEFRYTLSQQTKGIFRYNYLRDRLESEDKQYGRSRWWLRAKADQALPAGISARLDLDLASDSQYLSEFDDGPMGYDKTNQVFTKEFSRSLSDKTSVIRPSTLQLSRPFDEYFTGAELRYNYNLISQERDQTVQELPYIYATGFSQNIPKTPLFYRWDTTYINYWRSKDVRYQRIDIKPTIFLPVNLWNKANLLLYTSVEDTFYQVSNTTAGSGVASTPNRVEGEMGADISTAITRIFHWNSNYEIRHAIQPRLSWFYRPEVNQTDLPQIDAIDNLEPENKITFSLINYISTKKTDINGTSAFNDILRMQITGSYDIRKATEKLAPGEKRQPFSDIYTTTTFMPCKYLSLRYDMTYSPYKPGITNENFLVNASTAYGQHMRANFIYNHVTGQRNLDLNISSPIVEGLSVAYSTNRNLTLGTEVSSSYNVIYHAGCWSLIWTLTKNQEETRWMMNIVLTGLGGFGVK